MRKDRPSRFFSTDLKNESLRCRIVSLVIEVRTFFGYTACVDTLIQDVKEKKFKRVYLITGDDPWLRHGFLERLLKAAAGEDTLNRMDVTGNAFSLPELRAFTDTMPFFAERRVLVITDSGLLRSRKKNEPEEGEEQPYTDGSEETLSSDKGTDLKERADSFQTWLQNLPETAVVIFSETSCDGRNALYKLISKIGSITSAERPKNPGELRRFAMNLIGKSGVRITSGAFDRLMDRLPLDYGMAETEIEKLISYCLGKGSILLEDVEEMTAPRLEDRVFDLVERVSNGDRKGAMDLYYDLLRLRTAPLLILTLIGKDLVRLMNVQEMSRKGLSEREIMEALSFRFDWLTQKYQRTAGRFPKGALLRAVELEADLEQSAKNGNLGDAAALEILILNLTEDRRPSRR